MRKMYAVCDKPECIRDAVIAMHSIPLKIKPIDRDDHQCACTARAAFLFREVDKSEVPTL